MNSHGCMLKFIIRTRFSLLISYCILHIRQFVTEQMKDVFIRFDFFFFAFTEKFTRVDLRGFVTEPMLYLTEEISCKFIFTYYLILELFLEY